MAGSNSYGAQARGSGCKSEVVFSDGPIDFPHVTTADILVAMSQGTYDQYSHGRGRQTGLILYDASQVTPSEDLRYRQTGFPPPTRPLKRLKNKQAANIVLLGALSSDGPRLRGALKRAMESTWAAVPELNLEAFEAGRELGRRRGRVRAQVEGADPTEEAGAGTTPASGLRRMLEGVKNPWLREGPIGRLSSGPLRNLQCLRPRVPRRNHPRVPEREGRASGAPCTAGSTAPGAGGCPSSLPDRRALSTWRRGITCASLRRESILDALDVIREELPFPGIIGRICHHPCEDACLRGEKLDEAVSLCALKRFVADYEAGKREIPLPRWGRKRQKGGRHRRRAVRHDVRADLRKAGYGVTLFEGRDRLGGMLYFGVPAYRLPRKVLEREVSLIGKGGDRVRYHVRVGRDVISRKIRGTFDAIYIGCGASRGAKLGIGNEDAPGVMGGVEFLGPVMATPWVQEVIVVGGGNVAVDVALAAKGARSLRGADGLHRKAHGMPAGKWEKEEIREEGIRIELSLGTQAYRHGQRKVTGVECRRCTSVFDKEGRFSPSLRRKGDEEYSMGKR